MTGWRFCGGRSLLLFMAGGMGRGRPLRRRIGLELRSIVAKGGGGGEGLGWSA